MPPSKSIWKNLCPLKPVRDLTANSSRLPGDWSSIKSRQVHTTIHFHPTDHDTIDSNHGTGCSTRRHLTSATPRSPVCRKRHLSEELGQLADKVLTDVFESLKPTTKWRFV